VADTGLSVDVFVRRTPELIHLATCCMSVSGSVSLELLDRAKPTVILYWISPLAYAVQKRFRRVKYITLVNLLAVDELFPADTTPYDPLSSMAEEALFPEYLTCEDRSPQIARHVIGWLTDVPTRQRLIDRLNTLKAQVGHAGAAETAAQYILDRIVKPPRVPPPHYIPLRAAGPIAPPSVHSAAA
jgi:lipid-A-disaccharide synthase